MTIIRLPALDGRKPLAFLASVGLLQLATHHSDQTGVRLSWNPADCVAQLHAVSWSSVDDVANWLTDLVAGLGDDQLFPGFPADFPPPGAAPDKLVPTRPDFAVLTDSWPHAAEVIGALVTDLSINADGRARRTPMVAPTGKQSFHTMLSNQAKVIKAEPHRLREALAGWRRVPGTTGEGFDHAAIIGGADEPSGSPGERAVPGATWLAVAGLPTYRLAADPDGRTAATAWRRINRRPTLIWPLWIPALDLHAVRVLLEHPATTQHATWVEDQLVINLDDALKAMGVFRCCGAQRRSTGNADGPLVPLHVTSAASRA